MRRGDSQAGVVLVQVAFAMTAIAGCCALVIDYGVLWVARSQAQAAADAGALAGAATLAYDYNSLFDDGAGAIAASAAVAQQNTVWDGPLYPGDVVAQWVECEIPGLPKAPAPRVDSCIDVAVSRTSDSGHPLPTMFAKLLNLSSQNIRAHAMGAVAPANASDCVWPIAIPDKWQERCPSPPCAAWSQTSTFTLYAPTGPPTPAPAPDLYVAPTDKLPGTGFSVVFSPKIGSNQPLVLTQADFASTLTSGQFVPVIVPRLDGGKFADSLASCNQVPVSIGDTLAVDATGTLGAVTAAAGTRFSTDSGAVFSSLTWELTGSCAVAATPCAAISPRRVVLPVFDPNVYETTRWAGTPTIQIVNFVGFFITGVTSTEVDGNLTLHPGIVRSDKPMVGYVSGFLRTPVMYR